MIDDELAWQRREITGTTVHVCEQCGMPIPEGTAFLAEDETTADGGVGMRLCPICMEATLRGTAPIDLGDEDDEVGVG